MTLQSCAKVAGAVVTFVAIVLAGMSIKPPRAHADDDHTDARVRIGFKIAPVHLNLDDKDRDLVGLGSYIVNAQGDCNGCHTNPEFADGGNPYFKGQKKKIDPKKYLGGGVDFGNFGPNTPNIVSRNLTPDKTGRPEGGRTFSEFRQIMRTGVVG